MLLGQYLCWRHQACLVTIVDCKQHGQQSNNGFPATHITLQEAVHLFAGSCISPDFLYHSFLRTSQFEGKMFLIKCIELLAYFLEQNAMRKPMTTRSKHTHS